jgi:hypothetical protein
MTNRGRIVLVQLRPGRYIPCGWSAKPKAMTAGVQPPPDSALNWDRCYNIVAKPILFGLVLRATHSSGENQAFSATLASVLFADHSGVEWFGRQMTHDQQVVSGTRQPGCCRAPSTDP